MAYILLLTMSFPCPRLGWGGRDLSFTFYDHRVGWWIYFRRL